MMLIQMIYRDGLLADVKDYGTKGELPKGNKALDEQTKDVGCCAKISTTGCVLLVLQIVCRTAGITSSQIGAGSTNVFMLNIFRFFLQSLMTLAISIVTKTSLMIQRRYFILFFIWVFTNFTNGTCLIFTASFFPVGDMEALYVVLLIFITTVIDMLRKDIKLHNAITSIVAIVGVMMVTQLWNTSGESGVVDTVPCVYWQRKISEQSYNSTHEIMNTSLLTDTMKQNNQTISAPMSNFSQYVIINGVQHGIPFDPLILGYILLTVAAFMGSALGYTVKFSKDKIEMYALLFWSGLAEGLLSFTMNIFWSTLQDISLFSFPTEPICTVSVLLYILTFGTLNTLYINTIRVFNVSTIAVSYVCVTLLLYISQSTWLKAFHPGHANNLEVAGIVIIFCSFLITPMNELCNRFSY